MDHDYVTIRGIRCPVVKGYPYDSVDLRKLGVLDEPLPPELNEYPKIRNFLIQHGNVFEFLNKACPNLPARATVEIFEEWDEEENKYFTKTCQVDIDGDKIILDICYKVIQKSKKITFEGQQKLFQLILRGKEHLHLNTAGTFSGLKEVVIIDEGMPGDKTLIGYYCSDDSRLSDMLNLTGFTVLARHTSFDLDQSSLIECNLDFLNNAPNIKNIFVNHKSKAVLTKPLSHVSKVEELFVFNCKVANLLSQLQMSNMKKLVLHNCGLHIFPHEINQAKELVELAISKDNFSNESIDLNSLSKLKYLSLVLCNLVKHPDGLHMLQQLAETDLSHNHLNDCLKTMPAIPSLKRFYLARESGITVLPQELSKMTGLEKLDLCYNNFEQYGQGSNKDVTNLDQTGYLTELRKLDLSSCRLRKIPQHIFALSMIDRVDVSDNEIKELPDTVTKMLKRRGRIIVARNHHLEKPPRFLLDDSEAYYDIIKNSIRVF